MKLLYGTGNPAKISAMRQRLKELDIELTGLEDMKEQGYVTSGQLPYVILLQSMTHHNRIQVLQQPCLHCVRDYKGEIF